MSLADTHTANGFIAYTTEAVARCLDRMADNLSDAGGSPRQAQDLRGHAVTLREIAGRHRDAGSGIEEVDRFDMAHYLDHVSDQLAHGWPNVEGAALVPLLRMTTRAMGFEDAQARESEVPF